MKEKPIKPKTMRTSTRLTIWTFIFLGILVGALSFVLPIILNIERLKIVWAGIIVIVGYLLVFAGIIFYGQEGRKTLENVLGVKTELTKEILKDVEK